MKIPAGINFVVLFLFSLLILGACKKQNQSPGALLQKWQVVSTRRPHSSTQQYPVGTYILQFKPSGHLSFKLDVNNCGGDYAVNESGKIKMNILNCTEICCDSELAREIRLLLPHMDTYNIEDDMLMLSGTGQIKLKRIE